MRKTFAVGALVVLGAAACGGGGEATCRPAGIELSITADDHRFSTDCLAAPADQAFTIAFRNDDTSGHGIHNVEIFAGGSQLFSGEALRPGGTSAVYEVGALPAGTYGFRCTNHTFMRGSFVVA